MEIGDGFDPSAGEFDSHARCQIKMYNTEEVLYNVEYMSIA